MHKRHFALLLTMLILATLFGCSGYVSDASPVLPGESPDSVSEQGTSRILWGRWSIQIDLQEFGVSIEPARHLEAHYNVTDWLLPPACNDCLEIQVNSFDPVTRILDADVTLRNPYTINGHDVRGILYTNDYGHLLKNADEWTALFDLPGGDAINPFRAFAKGSVKRLFETGGEYTEKYLVEIPTPANYAAIDFAADVSFPGNCKEPYRIYDFEQNAIGSSLGSSAYVFIRVVAWQGEVAQVRLQVPEITGEEFSDFSPWTGNIWTLQLVNNTAAPPGIYPALVITSSTGSSDPLFDYVDIEIGEFGIASKYPGDVNIATDSAVIFYEDFEENTPDEMFNNWDEAKNPANMMLALDPAPDSAGDQSLRVRHIGGQDTGAHLYTRLLPGYDLLYVRFYVKFHQDCNKIHHFFHLGGYNPPTTWPQGGAGEKPNGDERFTTGVEPFGTAWRWDLYSYWMEMHDNPSEFYWGNDFINDPELAVNKGEWQCIELMMKMNDPVTERNGEMVLWIDGELHSMAGQVTSHFGEGFPNGGWVWDSFHPDPDGEPFEGFRWRMDEDLNINFLWLLVYITDAPAGYVSDIWYDQVVVATEYIGPISPQ